jgi:hypothetical protein
MAPRGIRRFAAPTFDLAEAETIHAKITAGRRAEADEELRHLVHGGVAPSELFEIAMALGRQRNQRGDT